MKNLFVILWAVCCVMLLACGGSQTGKDETADKTQRAAEQYVYGNDDGEFKSRGYFEKKMSAEEMEIFDEEVEQLMEKIYEDADTFAISLATADDMDDMRSIMGEVNDYAEGLSPEVAALFKDRVSEVIDDIMRGE